MFDFCVAVNQISLSSLEQAEEGNLNWFRFFTSFVFSASIAPCVPVALNANLLC